MSFALWMATCGYMLWFAIAEHNSPGISWGIAQLTVQVALLAALLGASQSLETHWRMRDIVVAYVVLAAVGLGHVVYTTLFFPDWVYLVAVLAGGAIMLAVQAAMSGKLATQMHPLEVSQTDLEPSREPYSGTRGALAWATLVLAVLATIIVGATAYSHAEERIFVRTPTLTAGALGLGAIIACAICIIASRPFEFFVGNGLYAIAVVAAIAGGDKLSTDKIARFNPKAQPRDSLAFQLTPLQTEDLAWKAKRSQLGQVAEEPITAGGVTVTPLNVFVGDRVSALIRMCVVNRESVYILFSDGVICRLSGPNGTAVRQIKMPGDVRFLVCSQGGLIALREAEQDLIILDPISLDAIKRIKHVLPPVGDKKTRCRMIGSPNSSVIGIACYELTRGELGLEVPPLVPERFANTSWKPVQFRLIDVGKGALLDRANFRRGVPYASNPGASLISSDDRCLLVAADLSGDFEVVKLLIHEDRLENTGNDDVPIPRYAPWSISDMRYYHFALSAAADGLRSRYYCQAAGGDVLVWDREADNIFPVRIATDPSPAHGALSTWEGAQFVSDLAQVPGENRILAWHYKSIAWVSFDPREQNP